MYFHSICINICYFYKQRKDTFRSSQPFKVTLSKISWNLTEQTFLKRPSLNCKIHKLPALPNVVSLGRISLTWAKAAGKPLAQQPHLLGSHSGFRTFHTLLGVIPTEIPSSGYHSHFTDIKLGPQHSVHGPSHCSATRKQSQDSNPEKLCESGLCPLF